MKYEEAKQFLKEGMKIRYISGNGGWSQCEGREWILTDFYPDGYRENREIMGNCSPGPIIKKCSDLDILTEADGVTPWVDPREKPGTKFKVGDRVKSTHEVNKGETGRIRCKAPGKEGCWIIDGFTYGVVQLEGRSYCEDFLQLLPDEPKEEKGCNGVSVDIKDFPLEVIDPRFRGLDLQDVPYLIFNNGFSTRYINPETKTSMNSVFQAIKAKLSPTDRVLVKHGFLNSDGSRTGQYRDQLQEMALNKLVEAEDTADFRKELAKELKQDEE